MKSRLEYPNTSTYSCRPGKSSQNQLYVYHNIDKTAESPQKQRHDNYIAKVVHWKLCEKCHLEKKDKWYEHMPDSVSKNDEVKLLWDNEHPM